MADPQKSGSAGLPAGVHAKRARAVPRASADGWLRIQRVSRACTHRPYPYRPRACLLRPRACLLSTWNSDNVTNSFWGAMKDVAYDLAWTTGVGNNAGFMSAGKLVLQT